jgi:neutral ceramidase
VIGAALHNLAPASVKFGQSFAGIAVNRRRAYPGGRNRTGQVDPDLPVITVEGTDGALRAILVGYACHATVLNIYQVSGDSSITGIRTAATRWWISARSWWEGIARCC